MEERAEKVGDLLDEIWAMAHVMRLLFEIKQDIEVRLNPHAITRFGKMIAANIVRINEILEILPDQQDPDQPNPYYS